MTSNQAKRKREHVADDAHPSDKVFLDKVNDPKERESVAKRLRKVSFSEFVNKLVKI